MTSGMVIMSMREVNMISLESLQKSGKARAPIMLLYGPGGIGKTTLATSFPAPVVIDIEDGLGEIKVDSFGPDVITSFEDVRAALIALSTEQHNFETLVIDSLDWLEPMVWAHACKENGWSDIEKPGFGKGYIAALAHWREYLDALTYLRNEGMTIIQVAHSQIKKFDNPETESYDRFEPKLDKRANGVVIEHSDAVLFANYDVSTTTSDQGFNKKKVRAIGQGERVVYAQERPSAVAKNRYGMPPEIAMEWHAIAQHVEFFNAKKEAA